MSIKSGSTPLSALLLPTDVMNINKPSFPLFLKNSEIYPHILPNIPCLKMKIKSTTKDIKWIYTLFMCDMVNPNFIPSSEILHLLDNIYHHTKLTYIFTDNKNWAQNYLTVSNLKLYNAFSDSF